ncbi:MAG: M43 family zinc metalloprotease [Bacteroidia bacterium]
MNIITKKISGILAFSLLIAVSGFSQADYLHCGSSEANQKISQKYSKQVAQTTDALETWTKNYVLAHRLDRISNGNSTQSSAPSPIYTIPIVFHIIHNYGAENISDAQVYDEMKILNRDYRKINPDTTAIIPSFKGIAADAGIHFQLANIDPNGNCTNGIDRIVSTLTYNADDNSKLDDWPDSKYLNIWVVASIANGAAGYAYLPPNAQYIPQYDGVLILSSYIGSIGTGSPITSRALTHEIGHTLNLEHPWGNTNQPGVACGDDGVTDTPITKGFTSCPSTPSQAAICNPPTIENYQNYMDYSYCSCMFTQGGVLRMRAALTSNIANRNNLWSTSNLIATGTNGTLVNVCAPKADFIANAYSVCAGSGLQFTDESWNGHPTSWLWTFPGGTPSTSPDSMPTIIYNTPGIYNVTLKASNGSGSNTLTKNSYVTVESTTPKYTDWFYSDGFENCTAVPNTDWSVNNPNSDVTWARTTSVAHSGSASVWINSNSNTAGNYDELISPSIDFSKITSPTLTFYLAYAQKSSTTNDQLQVSCSTNCGQTWNTRYNKSGATLSTGGVQTGNFVPNGSQWRQETVSISPFASSHDVRIKFKFVSEAGNNIYLDDINISGPAGVPERSGEQINLAVYPNPLENNSVISFILPDKENVNLMVYDILGRLVSNLENSELGAGAHTYSIGKNNLKPGIYFVKMIANGHLFVQKLMVNP